MTADVMDQPTGVDEVPAADEIRAMRVRIDEIDQAIIDLWQERARLSQQVGKTRMASGGTRLVLSREREIVERFRTALGPDGTQLALLLLRSGRGPLRRLTLLPPILELWLPFYPFRRALNQPQLQDRGGSEAVRPGRPHASRRSRGPRRNGMHWDGRCRNG